MTVAFNDVVQLSKLLSDHLSTLPSSPSPPSPTTTVLNWNIVSKALAKWYRIRIPHASTINILSVALYDLFGANGSYLSICFVLITIVYNISSKDENLEVLQIGCFKYFELGGRCIHDPVSLLSG